MSVVAQSNASTHGIKYRNTHTTRPYFYYNYKHAHRHHRSCEDRRVPYHAQPLSHERLIETLNCAHTPLVAHSSPSARCLAWCRSTSSWVKRKDLPQDAHSYAVRLPRALGASAGADTVDTDGVGFREELSAAAAGGSCPGCPRGGDGGRPRGEDAPGRSSATPSGSGRAAVSR